MYLGIQCGDDLLGAVPATQKQAIFEPSFHVSPLPNDQTNFLGPFAKGTPAQRFFYLVWAVKEEGEPLAMVGRAKVHLSHLRWSQVEEAVRSGKPLSVTLSPTDPHGRPRFGSIQGKDVRWQE
jgi:hypothetical protein